MAVGAGFRHTSFELYAPLVLEVPAQHSQDLPSEAEVRRPSPHHRKSDPLEGPCLVQDQGQGSFLFFLCFAIESFHLQENFPHCLLGSSISPVSSVPINPIPLLPLRHLKCSRASHHRIKIGTSAIGLSLVTFFGRTSLLQPFSSLFHLLRELHDFFSRVFWDFWVDAIDRIPLQFWPYTISKPFPDRTLLHLVRLPLISSIPHFSKACRPSSARFRHSANALPILSSLFHSEPKSLASSSSFFKICAPPLHAVGFVSLCRSPALPSALSII